MRVILIIFLILGYSSQISGSDLDRLFYKIIRDGDRLVIDTARWIKFTPDGIIIDKLHGEKAPKVYKARRFYENAYPQIFLNVVKQTDYDSYVAGKARWRRPDQWPMLAYDLWKQDMPLWNFMELGQFVIESIDLPQNIKGFYKYPGKVRGENDPEFYLDEDDEQETAIKILSETCSK